VKNSTILIIKPDLTRRSLIWGPLERVENSFKIIDTKYKILTDDEVKSLYQEHESKEFYDRLTTFMRSYPVFILNVTPLSPGHDAWKLGREVVDHIRNRFANPKIAHENCMHGSDSEESAARELSIFGW